MTRRKKPPSPLCLAHTEAAAVVYYGGRCACCGETHPEFLSIVPAGPPPSAKARWDGEEESNGFTDPGRFFGRLERDSWPTGFRVLCANCARGRLLCAGCPHEREKRA
jgi:hypothetical protein